MSMNCGRAQVRLRPLHPERGTREQTGGWVPHCQRRTSSGRTSGRGHCTPLPAAAAPRPGSSRRWTSPGRCGWATGWSVTGTGHLPCPSPLGCGREGRGPPRGGRDPRSLAQKEGPKGRGLGMEVQAWRETQKLGGKVKGHLTGGTKKRLCGRSRDPLLLVVPMEPGAKLHEGREGISPGGRQGHMRLKHPFQQCQHHVFLHLPEGARTQRVTLGPALPPLTCPSSVYP